MKTLRLIPLLAAAVGLLATLPLTAAELLFELTFENGLKSNEPLVLPIEERGNGGSVTDSHNGGEAWMFDGSTALEVELPDKELLHFRSGDSFTLEAWVRLERDKVAGPILTRGSGANYRLSISKDRLVGFSYYALGSWRSFEAVEYPLPLQTWAHVAAQYDGAAQKLALFIDGKLVAYEPIVAPIQANPTPSLFIGGTLGADRVRGLAGALGSIRIYHGLKYPADAEVGTPAFDPATTP